MTSERKNKGEWSELYSLLFILSRGEIRSTVSGTYSEDSKLPVIAVSQTMGKESFDFKIEDKFVVVLDHTTAHELNRVDRTKLNQFADLVLSRIKNGKGRSFSIPEADEVMSYLHLEKPTGGRAKSDLAITVYDPRIKSEVTQGFSIKSFIGSKPTLLNASMVTNVSYLIEGEIDNAEELRLNKLGPIELVTELVKRGNRIAEFKMDDRFSENLRMIDGQMDVLLAHLVWSSYLGQGRSMPELVTILSRTNPLVYREQNAFERYTHKIKDLLEAVALGMRPSDPWNGETDASGGNIIVTAQGEIICHHARDKDSLRDYLFNKTAIDTPSRKRHNFGKIESNHLNLNFQIRFK